MIIPMHIKNKKYLVRIFMLTTITTLFLIAVFSTSLYFGLKKSVKQNAMEVNRQIFEQMDYNISFTDKIVKDMCLSVFYNQDVSYLMSARHDEDYLYEAWGSMDRVRKNLLTINSQVHSLFIYNKTTRRYYGTYSGMLYEDKNLYEIQKKYNPIPVAKPVYRKFRTIYDEKGKQYDEVLSYFMYEQLDKDGNMNGGIVINIKPEWIISNIKKVNMLNPEKNEKLFIVTGDGGVLGDNSIKDFGLSSVDIYNKFIKPGVKDNGDFRVINQKINGTEYYISSMYMSEINWTIVKIQPISNVFYLLKKIQIIITVITLVFLALAVLIGMSISVKLYNPVNRLVKLVEPMVKNSSTGDISVLEDAIRNFEKNQKNYSIERSLNSNILKDNFVRQVILDSTALSEKDLNKEVEEKHFPLNLHQPFSVCLIKIDNYKRFTNTISNRDRQLIKFAICNITNEILEEKFKNIAVNMNHEQIAILLNVGENGEAFYKEVFEMLKKAQNYILEHFYVSFTAAVSPLAKSFADITRIYQVAMDYSHYSYALGKGAVITPDRVARNEQNDEILYNLQYEKKLEEYIKTADFENFEETLSEVFVQIAKQNHNNMFVSMARLISVVRRYIAELNNAQITPVEIEMDDITKGIFDFETIDEVYIKLTSKVRRVFDEISDSIDNKYSYIVEMVKGIIETRYNEPGLCLQEIASAVKMSANYVGKIFKDSTGVPVSQYINQVRIEMATKWLQNSELSVKDIMLKVGIESEAHFYRHFKKTYGITPKEYVLKAQNNP